MNVVDVCVKFYFWELIMKQNIAVRKNKSEKIDLKIAFSLDQTSSKYHWHQHMQKNMSFHLIYHMLL